MPVSDEVAPRLWPGAAGAAPDGVPRQRLRSHTLRLSDGRRIGLTVGGRGIPLVVAHGFSFAGGLYVQSLSRLASMGFRVLAVDLAGHGGSAGLGLSGWGLSGYRRFLSQVLDELGVRRAVLCGHSLGGRLVAELAAAEPERAIALLLVDAAVGEAWDDLAAFACWNPVLLGVMGATLVADTLHTLFQTGDQGLKLQGLALPQATANAVAPWKLVAPALSVLLSARSALTLARLKTGRVPVFVLHGDRDQVVPLAAARDAAARSGGELTLVHGAAHSWILEDPETLRSIVAELLGDGLRTACLEAIAAAGLDPATVSLTEMESAFYTGGALATRLGPATGRAELRPGQAPRFSWSRVA
ncbi:MAG TPA: alpha/beta hydrolase [Acidimicrobiia bacterium]|nr:alpha/beta hydrolase [Acidimicrobiia bacterium]